MPKRKADEESSDKPASKRKCFNQLISLMVGGKLFVVERIPLLKAAFFELTVGAEPDRNFTTFPLVIDRDPTLFPYVIGALTGISLPPSTTKRRVVEIYEECMYFQVNAMVSIAAAVEEYRTNQIPLVLMSNSDDGKMFKDIVRYIITSNAQHALPIIDLPANPLKVLLIAIKCDNVWFVKKFLEAGAHKENLAFESCSLMCVALREGAEEVAAYLFPFILARSCHCNHMFLSASSGSVRCMQLFVEEYGVLAKMSCETALTCATGAKKPLAVEWLLDNGAAAGPTDTVITAFKKSLRSVECTKVFLAHTTDTSPWKSAIPDILGTISVLVIPSKDVVTIYKLLVAAGALIRDGSNPICIALSRGHIDSIRYLLQQGVPPTILSYFANKGDHIACIDFLVSAGANVEEFNSYGNTALSRMAACNLINLATHLVKTHGADIYNCDVTKGSRSAMAAAVSNGRTEIVNFFSDYKQPPNHPEAILTLAIQGTKIQIVDILVTKGWTAGNLCIPYSATFVDTNNGGKLTSNDTHSTHCLMHRLLGADDHGRFVQMVVNRDNKNGSLLALFTYACELGARRCVSWMISAEIMVILHQNMYVPDKQAHVNAIDLSSVTCEERHADLRYWLASFKYALSKGSSIDVACMMADARMIKDS